MTEEIEEKNLEGIDDFIEEETEDFRYSITSYGADYTVDRIVTRIDSGKKIIPNFQRKLQDFVNLSAR